MASQLKCKSTVIGSNVVVFASTVPNPCTDKRATSSANLLLVVLSATATLLRLTEALFERVSFHGVCPATMANDEYDV